MLCIIPSQQALALQKADDTVGDDVRLLGEFLAGWRLDSTEPGCSIGSINIHPIKEQHVAMDIEVQRRAKSLDEGDGTRPGRVACTACFPEQMRRNDTVDDAQQAPHDPGPAGEQDA